MIPSLIEKIKDEVWKAFAYRVYNVFKSFVIPSFLAVLILFLQKEEGQIDFIITGEFWEWVVYTLLLNLAGSTVAGLDKIDRMTKTN
jgi:hypothetical protein